MAFTRENALGRLIQKFVGEESDLIALAKNFRALFLWAEAPKDIWTMRNQDELPTAAEWPVGTQVVVNEDIYIRKASGWVKVNDAANTPPPSFVSIAKWGTD